MGTTAIAVAISRAERRLIKRLRRVGAFSPETAQPLPELPRLERRRLQRLLDAGAILESDPGSYFVDDVAYRGYRNDRRAIVFSVLVLLVGVVVVLALLSEL